MIKEITLCADDFGYNALVSQGIIDLIGRQRLSATSCMTNLKDWNQKLPELLKFKTEIKVGLHFNLTEGFWLSDNRMAPGLNTLILQSHTRRLDLKTIRTEFLAQISAFQDSVGSLPDFIDGHQHIQQLPVIRAVIIGCIKELYSDKKPALRISSNGLASSFTAGFKSLMLHLLGAVRLKRQAVAADIPVNTGFAGIYDLKPESNYPALFETWLRFIPDQGLIMCHPGLKQEQGSHDPIAAARFQEYQFFSSDAFLAALQKNHVRIG